MKFSVLKSGLFRVCLTGSKAKHTKKVDTQLFNKIVGS